MPSADFAPVDGRRGHWRLVREGGTECRIWIDEPPDTIQGVIDEAGSFYELAALRMLRRILPARARIIDVGANIGNHAVFFCRLCDASRVVLIEPNPEVLPELRANIEMNACVAADLSRLGIAAGERRGRSALRLDAADAAIRNRGATRLTDGAAAHGDATVEIGPLDDLVDGDFDLLKIDTEGMSLPVLRGASHLIARCRPLIHVEIGLVELPAFVEWLREHSYRVVGALSDYPGLTNFIIEAGAASGTMLPPPSDLDRRLADALMSESAAEARAQRADATLAIAVERATRAEHGRLEVEQLSERVRTDIVELQTQVERVNARAAEATRRATAAGALAAAMEADLSRGRAHQEALVAEAKRIAAENEDRARVAEAAAAELERYAHDLNRHIGNLDAEIARLTAIEASTWWHATGPLRRATASLSPGTRRQMRRTAKLLWWTASMQLPARIRRIRASRAQRTRPVHESRMGTAADGEPDTRGNHTPVPAKAEAQTAPRPREAAAPLRPAADSGRPHALIIDAQWPDPTRDSGSIDACNYAHWLVEFGFDVTFFSDSEFHNSPPHRAYLERLGIVCGGPDIAASPEQFVRQHGAGISLAFLSRVYSGGRHFEAVRRHCPDARVVFNAVDLHGLREEREARHRGDRRALMLAAGTLERERYLTRQADTTIVVSQFESSALVRMVPGARIATMPLIREVVKGTAGFDERDGVGFVGGFRHPPNVDAILYFLNEIWPLVLERDPACHLEIVGADLPLSIRQMLPANVHYLGQIPDLTAWLARLRLTVAPLRYGAGAKGKVASSLAHGVPVVGTGVAMEGMGMCDGRDALVAVGPESFAQAVATVHGSPDIWRELSATAVNFARINFSQIIGRRLFAEMLCAIDVPGCASMRGGVA